jgi:hypothetical protein
MKVFILFQTDIHKTAQSKVLFGVFTSEELAVSAAKENDLFSHESEILIEETNLNQFGEI